MQSGDIVQPTLCIYTRTDEVNLVFFAATSIIGLSRIISLIFKLSNVIYHAYLSKIWKSIQPIALTLVLTLAGCATVVATMGEMGGQHVSYTLIREYVEPLIVVAAAMAVGPPIVIMIGVFVFGTSNAFDLLSIDISHSLEPREFVICRLSVVGAHAFHNLVRRRNTHTAIMYGEEVVSEIVQFLVENVRDVARGPEPADRTNELHTI
jgi:hypothetical protein